MFEMLLFCAALIWLGTKLGYWVADRYDQEEVEHERTNV